MVILPWRERYVGDGEKEWTVSVLIVILGVDITRLILLVSDHGSGVPETNCRRNETRSEEEEDAKLVKMESVVADVGVGVGIGIGDTDAVSRRQVGFAVTASDDVDVDKRDMPRDGKIRKLGLGKKTPAVHGYLQPSWVLSCPLIEGRGGV
ncbi:hypothetical protein BDQ17DRAFT_1332235 [Cyathus striatus]|nr:hypothetical protein BDQ17DRAFT_1332235 [Cyathus striatus]